MNCEAITNTTKKTYMKVSKCYIFFQLFIACLVFTARAQETTNQLPPIKTGGPALHQTVAKPVLPIKSGDNVQQAKLQQVTAVPIRKTDAPPAPSAGGEAAKNKITKDNKAVIALPSSMSLKEAREQQLKALSQPSGEVTPKQ